MSLTLFSSTISSSKIGTSDTARMLLLLEKKKLKLNNNEIRTNYFSDKFPTMTRLLLSKNHHQIQPLFLGQFFGILHFNIDFLITEKKKYTQKNPNNIIVVKLKRLSLSGGTFHAQSKTMNSSWPNLC